MLRLVPLCVGADPLIRPGGQLDNDVLETEIRVDLEKQIDKGRHLILDLVFGTENMRIVLGEVAHPHQAMQRAGRFIAVAGAELGHA